MFASTHCLNHSRLTSASKTTLLNWNPRNTGGRHPSLPPLPSPSIPSWPLTCPTRSTLHHLSLPCPSSHLNACLRSASNMAALTDSARADMAVSITVSSSASASASASAVPVPVPVPVHACHIMPCPGQGPRAVVDFSHVVVPQMSCTYGRIRACMPLPDLPNPATCLALTIAMPDNR